MGMRELSLNAVCPMSSIDEICKKANIIKSVDDLNVIAGLRVKFTETFFLNIRRNNKHILSVTVLYNNISCFVQ